MSIWGNLADRAIDAIGNAIFGGDDDAPSGGGGGAPSAPRQEKTSLLQSSIAMRQRRGIQKADIARKQAKIDAQKGKGLKSVDSPEAALIAAFRRARAEAGKTNKGDFAGRTRV
jgi:hypothetical protein|tara:strand:- start:5579 stop:5920 length:342 start_codon:yes stop_codon:yes gene_type:complete